MSEIQRYAWYMNHGIDLAPGKGEYVLYTDHLTAMKDAERCQAAMAEDAVNRINEWTADIVALKAENARLRDALREMVEVAEAVEWEVPSQSQIERARAALSDSAKEGKC